MDWHIFFIIIAEGIFGDIVLPSISNDIDIYSAAGDEIYYLDDDDEKIVVCATDNSGYGVIPADTLKVKDYTLYSSIAKNPDDLEEYFSRSFTLTEDTDNIMLMPEGIVVYWYGYNSQDYTLSYHSSIYTYQRSTGNLISNKNSLSGILYSNGTQDRYTKNKVPLNKENDSRLHGIIGTSYKMYHELPATWRS